MSLDFTRTIKDIVDYETDSIHTAIPGYITEINLNDVDVQPTVAISRSGESVTLPLISNVPIMFPQSSKGGIRWELSVGDNVLLVVASCSIDAWLSSMGDKIVPALDAGKHQLKDAIAIPGLFTDIKAKPLVNDFGLEVRHNETTITIKKTGDVEIGGVGAQKLVTDSFIDAFNDHTHPADATTPTVPIIKADVTTKKTSAL